MGGWRNIYKARTSPRLHAHRPPTQEGHLETRQCQSKYEQYLYISQMWINFSEITKKAHWKIKERKKSLEKSHSSQRDNI